MINLLKKILCLTFVAKLGLTAISQVHGERLLDGIAAIVGNDVIALTELDLEIQDVKLQFRQSGRPLPNEADLRRQVLDRMISRHVLATYSDRTGIRVRDDEVIESLDEIAKTNGLTVEGYVKALEENGVSFENIRRRLIDQIKITKLRQRDVDSKVRINAAEIDELIAKDQLTDAGNTEFLAAHILVKIPNDVAERDARLKIEEVIRRIDEGNDFRTVAAEMSDANDALEGGLLGWRTADQLPALFVEAVRLAKVGERSEVMKSANGFHVLFLFDKRGGQAEIVVNQARVSHILIKVDPYGDEELSRLKAVQIRDRLVLGNEVFAEVAKSTSEDISASNGGDLGWLSPGETVPEFEEAVRKLKTGEISEIIRTRFGFHIILVSDRRDADLSDERKRLAAEQTLKRRKLEEKFEDWVSELRDRTYIEIKDY